MDSLKSLFSLYLLFGLTLLLSAQNKIVEAQVDSIFSEYNNSNKPGAAVAVVKGDQIVFKKGYGSANLEYGIPITPSSVFHIASVSKQFTVFAILLLEQDGKLSFDDEIRTYIPEVPDFGETITLRHLASHTSGMRDQWDLVSMAGWRWDDVITKEHILKMVANQKELNFRPGEEYNYCNTGFTLLAEVVARISGKSFAEFTEERIFKPLNMNKTLFYDDHQKIVQNRAYSYFQADDIYKKSVLNYANVGATSLFTTVEDLSRWAMNFKNPKVGNNEIFNKMNSLAVLNNGETFGGAYGQFVGTYKGLNQIQHGGADAGYRSYLGRFPDQDLAVIVFSNYASTNAGGLALQVANLFLSEFINEEIEDSVNDSTVKFVNLTKDRLSRYKGHYWNEAGNYSREILVKNDTLRYSRGEDNQSILMPISENEFKMLNVGVNLRVKFENLENEPSMIVTIDGGEPIISKKYLPKNYSKEILKEYIGKFYSPELNTTYNIVLKDDQLVATHQRLSDFILTPLKDDIFSASYWLIKYDRNNIKKITGLNVTTGRVRNLKFHKLD